MAEVDDLYYGLMNFVNSHDFNDIMTKKQVKAYKVVVKWLKDYN